MRDLSRESAIIGIGIFGVLPVSDMIQIAVSYLNQLF